MAASLEEELKFLLDIICEIGTPDDWELAHPSMRYVTVQMHKETYLEMRAYRDMKLGRPKE